MAVIGKCASCGADLQSDLVCCPKCGTRNPAFGMPREEFIRRLGQELPEESGKNAAKEEPAAAESIPEAEIVHPKTIEELKLYCAQKHMPLERMRFFLDQDYPSPKAFGIYRDGGEFVVYKNKADGSRAVRYRGKDEAYAVNELFEKLLEECHQRGIYPDGVKMSASAPRTAGTGSSAKKSSGKGLSKAWTPLMFVLAFFFQFLIRYIVVIGPLVLGVIVVTILLEKLVINGKLVGEIHWGLRAAISAVLVLTIAFSLRGYLHRNDGYYSPGDGSVRYHYGSDSYYAGQLDPSWAQESISDGGGIEIYLGDRWNSSWGSSYYSPPTVWDDVEDLAIETSSHGSSSDSWDSDWDDWDSGDTDWDSDW